MVICMMGMKDGTNMKKKEMAAEIVFYLLVFAAIACFAMIQTYGDPPDEINRFKVVNYIINHGRLPHGADPEVILAGYGASYAFQPILTYILQGFLLRFLKLFTTDGYLLLLAARMVNAAFGVLMAYYVRRIAKEAWKNPYIQWVFTLLVVFLPQNIFIHSYVNTDSMAMLSVAMIFYALLRAQRTGYDRKGCILLAAGIILCAMSYYNAYGMILAAMLVFALHYIHMEKRGGKKRLNVEWKELLRKGGLISAIVLLGIGWWFIRNAVLYDGDIIAMNARLECAIETAAPDYNPQTRFTYSNSGTPLKEMLFSTGYITLLRDSFIAMFGPMIIPTHGLIYIYYKRLWIVTVIAALLPVDSIKRKLNRKGQAGEAAYGKTRYEKTEYGEDREWTDGLTMSRKSRMVFYGSMLLFSLITIGLSIFYSYTWEFQPQGRYILPVLIPFMYLVTLGIQKLCILLDGIRIRRGQYGKSAGKTEAIEAGRILAKLMCFGIMAYVMLAFAYSLFDRFIPYYMQGENMFSMYGKAFVP